MAANKNELFFRRLKSNEIEVRASRINKGGVNVLLYLDARAVMKILDESVGPFKWRREHRTISGQDRLCIISIYCDELGQWVSKEDVGSESNVEKEKGQISDSFKRCAVNWGIGRELYTAPDIFIRADRCTIKEQQGRNGKPSYACYDKFNVDRIMYNDEGEIIYVRVINQTRTQETGKLAIAYEYTTPEANKRIEESRAAAAAKKAQAANVQQQQPQEQPRQAQATQQQPQQRPQQQGRPTQQQGQQAQRGNGQATQPQQRPQQQQQRPQPQPQPQRGNVDSGPLPFDVLPFPTLEDLGFSPTYEDDDEDELPFCN